MDVHLGPVASQRIERQRRTQRRSADADVDQMPHFAQQTGMNRLNQAFHPLVQRGGFLNRGIAAHATLSGVFHRAAFGDIDRLAREHRPPLLTEANRIGQRQKGRAVSTIEMGLRPVKPDRPARKLEPAGPSVQPP